MRNAERREVRSVLTRRQTFGISLTLPVGAIAFGASQLICLLGLLVLSVVEFFGGDLSLRRLLEAGDILE